MELGNRTEPGEQEGPERELNTITADGYLDALWTYILGLVRAGVEEVQDRLEASVTDESQTYDYVQIPLDVVMNYHSRAERFAARLLKERASAILKKLTKQKR